MLYSLLQNRKSTGSVSNFRQELSWEEFARQTDRFATFLDQPGWNSFGLTFECELAALACCIALNKLRKTCLFVPSDHSLVTPCDVQVHALPSFRLEIEENENKKAGYETDALVLYSSGTTGTPVAKNRLWATLTDNNHVPGFQPDTHWISAYPLDAFAGIQAAIYGLAAAEHLYFIPPNQYLPSFKADAPVFDLVMATPTFWRRNLLHPDLNIRVRSLSLGGEAVPQVLIDLLKERLKVEKITHIYATTELGSLFSVSDEREGFPKSWLGNRLSNGTQLEAIGEELWVTVSGTQEAQNTGDLIEIRGDRVCFTGRKESIINVGGRKVSAHRVETALLSMDAIADARVQGARNPIMGQIVVADIIPRKGADESQIRADIITRFKKHHRPEERPMRIRFVEEFELTRTGKKKI